MRKSRLALWAVPAAAAVVVAGFSIFPNVAGASPLLPAVTPQQLAANVATLKPVALSGQVQVDTNIGLPDLGGLSGILGVTQSADLTNLLTGTTTIKVAEDPKTGARAEIDASTSAYVAVANLTTKDGWTYSSAQNTATHYVMPPQSSTAKAPKPAEPTTTVPTPQSIGQQFVDALTPSTNLSVARTDVVAGRDAYTLVLTPRSAGSLIASVDIAVDAQTWLPLSVQVWSVQQTDKPALSIAFTSISYATPDASLFSFTPPQGTTVTTAGQDAKPADTAKPAKTTAPEPTPTVVAGEGWSSVVKVTNVGDVASALTDPTQIVKMLGGAASGSRHGQASSVSTLVGELAQQTPEGTVYSTNLVTLLVTPNGTVYAGAVPASALEAAAKASK